MAGCTPEAALRHGGWRKLICGASNQDLAAITDLAWVYTRAGIHCIDVAPDPAVAAAARQGIAAALKPGQPPPWLMVSLNDDTDPHFRKAHFDPGRCPPDCHRPCEATCPVEAISTAGVATARCYGCGRCLSICPLGLIQERSWRLERSKLLDILAACQPDALEIHTRPGALSPFTRLLALLQPLLPRLRLLAVSVGGPLPQLVPYLWRLHGLLLHQPVRHLWQLDGRPMSGDLGSGATHAAVALALGVSRHGPPGPLQVAGGVNRHTSTLLERHGLAGNSTGEKPPAVVGMAFGGAARKLLRPWLAAAQAQGRTLRENHGLAQAAVAQAQALLNLPDEPQCLTLPRVAPGYAAEVREEE